MIAISNEIPDPVDMHWITITQPAPVLNRADFSQVFGGSDGRSLPLDKNGHPEPYEFVALPHTSFKIRKQVGEHILEVEAPTYSIKPVYMDIRFGHTSENEPAAKPFEPLSSSLILKQMESRIGTPYVWGGNWANGIPKLLEFYPPRGALTPRTKELWTWNGLDCSGLLYEATNGATPRNTSQLVKYGKPLALSKMAPFEAISFLKPLDMIVYSGHVLFVRNQETIIESKSPFGVRVCPIRERLSELLNERKLVDEWTETTDSAHSFMIRRFIFANPFFS